VQRFGDALNLNVHFHSLVLDGVYAPGPDGALRFHPLPPPDDAEVERVVAQVARRLARLLERHGSSSAEASAPRRIQRRPIPWPRRSRSSPGSTGPPWRAGSPRSAARASVCCAWATASTRRISGRSKASVAPARAASACTRTSPCRLGTAGAWNACAGTWPALRSRRSASRDWRAAGCCTGSSTAGATARPTSSSSRRSSSRSSGPGPAASLPPRALPRDPGPVRGRSRPRRPGVARRRAAGSSAATKAGSRSRRPAAEPDGSRRVRAGLGSGAAPHTPE
jgi:hypothetical protein